MSASIIISMRESILIKYNTKLERLRVYLHVVFEVKGLKNRIVMITVQIICKAYKISSQSSRLNCWYILEHKHHHCYTLLRFCIINTVYHKKNFGFLSFVMHSINYMLNTEYNHIFIWQWCTCLFTNNTASFLPSSLYQWIYVIPALKVARYSFLKW